MSAKTAQTEWEDVLHNGIEIWVRALDSNSTDGICQNLGVFDRRRLIGSSCVQNHLDISGNILVMLSPRF